MESEDGFFEGRFGDFESDFFEYGPLVLIGDIIEIDLVFFNRL